MKKLFQIEPEHPMEAAEPSLYIRIGTCHCSYAIVDQVSQSVQKLVYYTTVSTNENSLNEMISIHPELTNDFNKTVICYDYAANMLEPVVVDTDPDPVQLLKDAQLIDKPVLLTAISGKYSGIRNSYLVPESVHHWMKDQFKSAVYVQQDTVFLDQLTDINSTGMIWIDFRKDDFLLVAIKNDQLLISQLFPYVVPADVLFPLLKICNRFGLLQKDAALQLSGLIDKDSVLYKELYQYFIHISFRDMTWDLPVNEYPSHFFTALNDLAICAS